MSRFSYNVIWHAAAHSVKPKSSWRPASDSGDEDSRSENYGAGCDELQTFRPQTGVSSIVKPHQKEPFRHLFLLS